MIFACMLHAHDVCLMLHAHHVLHAHEVCLHQACLSAYIKLAYNPHLVHVCWVQASGEEGEAEAGAKRRKLGADALPGWGEDDDVDADGVQGQEAGTEAGMVGGGESRLVHLSHLRPCTKVFAPPPHTHTRAFSHCSSPAGVTAVTQQGAHCLVHVVRVAHGLTGARGEGSS